MNQDADRDLSQLYRLGAKEVPPPSLDRRIEAAAQREVRPSVFQAFFDSLSRGRLAAGALAVVTLSVSLVSLMRDEAPELLDPASSRRPQIEASKIAKMGAEEPPKETRAQRFQPSDADTREARQSPVRRVPESRAETRQEPAPESSVMKREAVTEAPQLPKRDGADQLKSAESSGPSVRLAEPPAAVTAAPAAPPPAVSPNAHDRSPGQTNEGVTVGRTASRERKADVQASTGSTEDTPEVWLVRVSDLMRQGRDREARDELERFRRRYPNHPLPEDIRRLSVEVPDAGGAALPAKPAR